MQEHNCSLKAAAQKARITLKEIESLTYTCISSTDLVLLGQQLDDMKTSFHGFQSKLPRSESIIIRASAVETANRTKKKYASLMARQRRCSVLTARGRRKGDSRFRNRVGVRADRLRKVN